jgi:hypothetical protein
MAFVAFGNPFPFAIQAYLLVMQGAAFALAFFFGAVLLFFFRILSGSSCFLTFVKTFVTMATIALLKVCAKDLCHLFL